jgi:hypothetical protein
MQMAYLHLVSNHYFVPSKKVANILLKGFKRALATRLKGFARGLNDLIVAEPPFCNPPPTARVALNLKKKTVSLDR